MDQIPHQKKIVDTSLGTQPSKFDRFLRSLKLEGTSKQIEGFQPDLKTAHRRLDQLKKSYKEGDPIWQDFLTKTSAGKRLILVFLGARPCAEFHDEELQRELGKMGYRFGPKFIEYLLRKN